MEGLLDTLLCILILTHKKVANRYYVTGQEPNGALGVTDVLGHLSSETWRAEWKAGTLAALGDSNLWPALFQKGCKSSNKLLFLHLSFPDLGIHLLNLKKDNNIHTQIANPRKTAAMLKIILNYLQNCYKWENLRSKEKPERQTISLRAFKLAGFGSLAN